MMKISRQKMLRKRQAMIKLMKSKQRTELLYMILAMLMMRRKLMYVTSTQGS